jgi:hypothetical protein
VTPEQRQTTIAKLSRCFLQAQPDIREPEAERIAERVGSDEQILDIASRWMETGAWPSEPALEGWTPADLGRLGYRPSFVLTALLWLKQDPAQALESLKHAFIDHEAYRPNVTNDPVAAGFFSHRPIPPPSAGEVPRRGGGGGTEPLQAPRER